MSFSKSASLISLRTIATLFVTDALYTSVISLALLSIVSRLDSRELRSDACSRTTSSPRGLHWEAAYSIHPIKSMRWKTQGFAQMHIHLLQTALRLIFRSRACVILLQETSFVINRCGVRSCLNCTGAYFSETRDAHCFSSSRSEKVSSEQLINNLDIV